MLLCNRKVSRTRRSLTKIAGLHFERHPFCYGKPITTDAHNYFERTWVLLTRISSTDKSVALARKTKGETYLSLPSTIERDKSYS